MFEGSIRYQLAQCKILTFSLIKSQIGRNAPANLRFPSVCIHIVLLRICFSYIRNTHSIFEWDIVVEHDLLNKINKLCLLHFKLFFIIDGLISIYCD